MESNYQDRFRTARTLLGLTQRQVANRMGISVQAIRDIETDNGVRPARKNVQYYDCWLREFARVRNRKLLGTVDAILSNERFARMFHVVEPNHKAGRPHRTKIIELDKIFESTTDAARWLVEHRYARGQYHLVAQRIRNAINRTSSERYLGFTYCYDDNHEVTDIM